MNVAHLVGRLTHDVDTTMTHSGKAVASFQVATNEFRGGKEEAEFHRCVAWEKTADRLGEKGKKGRLVEINGRLQTREYQDRSGNTVKATEIVVNHLAFLDKDPTRSEEPEKWVKKPETPAVDVDDIPF